MQDVAAIEVCCVMPPPLSLEPFAANRPFGHGSHSEEPDWDAYPLLQAMQVAMDVEDADGLYFPAGH